MNDKTHHHLTPQEKLAIWSLLRTNGSKEQALSNLTNIKNQAPEEAHKELLRAYSFCALWSIIDEAKKSFSTLLKNDSSGKIFIICSSLASSLKGLFDNFTLQFPIDDVTKTTIRSSLTLIQDAVTHSMSNAEVPQRTYKNQTLPFVFSPSDNEKQALLISHELLTWLKSCTYGQALQEHSIRYAKAFIALYNDAVPLFDMPLHSKEEALILCHLINIAVLSGISKSLNVSGIQGCDEKKQASHLAFSFTQSLDKDISALLHAYTSW